MRAAPVEAAGVACRERRALRYVAAMHLRLGVSLGLLGMTALGCANGSTAGAPPASDAPDASTRAESVTLRAGSLRATFGRTIEVSLGEETWKLRPTVDGVEPKQQGDKLVFASGDRTEWWQSTARGLEQGWSIGASGPSIDLPIAVEGLTPRLVRDGALLLGPNGVARLHLGALSATDAAGRALPARLALRGAPAPTLFVHVDARGAQFPVSIDPIYSVATAITANAGDSADGFGSAVALSGDTLIVGGPQHAGSGSASAQVFVRTASGWSWQATLRESAASGLFASAVAIDGDVAFVGDPYANGGIGAVYSYARSGGAWSRVDVLDDSKFSVSGTTKGGIGQSIALSGGKIVVGSPGSSYGAGCVLSGVTLLGSYTSSGNFGSWLVGCQSSTMASFGSLGYAVAANGNLAFSGVSGPGQVMLYHFDDAYAYQLIAPTTADTSFGSALAASASQLFVGVPSAASGGVMGAGAVEVFDGMFGSSFAESQTLAASDPQPNAVFGTSVAVSGDLLAVGAPSYAGTIVGGVYLFRQDASTKKWSEVAKLQPTSVKMNDLFGKSVALDGAVVGGTIDGTAYVLLEAGGEVCETGAQCASGQCVEGVCCDSACTDGCKSCLGKNTGGADGTCATIADGTDPKAACSGGYCASGSCATKQTAGASCKKTYECQSGNCVEGVCCDTSCTDGCKSCLGKNTGGADGTCAPITKGTDPKAACSSCTSNRESIASCDGAGSCATPVGRDCLPYACDAHACHTTCAVDGDCQQPSYKCTAGACVPSTSSVCADDHTVQNPDGTKTTCVAFKCDKSTGICGAHCASSDDCQSGFSCQTSSGNCTANGPTGSSGGGCAMAARPGSEVLGGLGLLASLAALGLGRRKRQRS
jgi:hypothetical protein